MKTPEVPPPRAGNSLQKTISEGDLLAEAATLLAGLERQKEELGPIAEELIELLRHLGVDKPPLQDSLLNPSSE
jgi:hypothetical protein